MSKNRKLPIHGSLYMCSGRQTPAYPSPIMGESMQPTWIKFGINEVVLLLGSTRVTHDSDDTTIVKLLTSDGKVFWTWWWRGEDYKAIS